MEIFTIEPGPRQECGECTACCTTMGVTELEKPPHVPCRHLCPTGCGVYQDRPASCQAFECLWLNGHIDGRPQNRPDRLGVIFVPNDSEKLGPFIQVNEVRPGAVDSEKVRYMLEKISRKDLVMIRRVDGRLSGMGPMRRLQRAITLASQVTGSED